METLSASVAGFLSLILLTALMFVGIFVTPILGLYVKEEIDRDWTILTVVPFVLSAIGLSGAIFKEELYLAGGVGGLICLPFLLWRFKFGDEKPAKDNRAKTTRKEGYAATVRKGSASTSSGHEDPGASATIEAQANAFRAKYIEMIRTGTNPKPLPRNTSKAQEPGAVSKPKKRDPLGIRDEEY